MCWLVVFWCVGWLFFGVFLSCLVGVFAELSVGGFLGGFCVLFSLVQKHFNACLSF